MIEVSVVIPCYNHAAYLKQRIETVIAQTIPPKEIIILDDASTDNSREIIEQYRNHPLVKHIVFNTVNAGSPFKQWQKGLALCSCEWVWIAESDDFAEPIFIETAAVTLQGSTSAGIFYSDAVLTDDKNAETLFSEIKNRWAGTLKWSSDYHVDGRIEIEESLGLRCTINNASSVLIRRALLNECIDEVSTFKYHGDWYAYIRAALHTDISYSAKVLNHFRSHTSGIAASLPGDGKNKTECFRILCLLFNVYDKRKRTTWLMKFVRSNLQMGLWSGRREWQSFFTIDRKIAMKVLKILFWQKILPSKKKQV